ncbi:uncharacterized protein NEMAJ01_1815 [Nematocida major]|uniref:uncharacterized protein n=1 Tax=Nematocida major TaxID=1912982 RepID=UPI002007EF3E|nr:uncharacterized protein NEMAJ01_1815 [Nematocida major]KAH9386919.1 hypothetical protein NEMAJ01_1815 [Nematocida major]
MREILFTGRVPAVSASGRSEFSCEITRREETFQMKMYDPRNFTIFLCRLTESEYFAVKERQSIRVDYAGFVRALCDLLKRVQRGDLYMEVDESVKIIERNPFRNILHLELNLHKISEAEYRGYAAEILSEITRKKESAERESAGLREEIRRIREREEAEQESARRRDEERRNIREREEAEQESARKRAEEALSREEEAVRENERLQKQSRVLEEDLKKANEIIRKNFEELKSRVKAESLLRQELNEHREERASLEEECHRLEMQVLEAGEEIKLMKEMESERKEAIGSLKALNKSLSRKLESTYRIYNRVYKETDDDTKTEESSIVAPESVQY